MTKVAVGIDLGTTNSCVAVFQNGKVEVIANSQGHRITPSIVSFTESGHEVGLDTAIHSLLRPASTVSSAKRFIGRDYEEPAVQALLDKYPFKIKKTNRGGVAFEVEKQEGQTILVQPEEVSSKILAQMKRIAEDYLDKTVTDAVITVPAYFTHAQRQATQDAGRIAGLNVLRIINEPTAAALAYDLGIKGKPARNKEKNVLIFDLGGGTFDISILNIMEDVVEVLATRGDTALGGEDFNLILLKLCKARLMNQKVDITGNKRAEKRLLAACERAKHALSDVKTVHIEVDILVKGVDFSYLLTREMFEEACTQLFLSTLRHVTEALTDAKLTKSQIDEVILVGGSTRIPKIQQLLVDYFGGKALNKSVNPDEVVACGAAIQAAILSGVKDRAIQGIVLMDVTPLSLGVDIIGGRTSFIVGRNSSIPIRKSKTYLTTTDNETIMEFDVLQGERVMAKDNRVLATFTLSGLPPKPRGEAKCNVVFDIDANGILSVTATSLDTGRKEGITISNSSSGLTEAEVEAQITKAEAERSRDKEEEARVIAQIELNYLCSDMLKMSHDANSVSSVMAKHNQTWMASNTTATEQEIRKQIDRLKLVAQQANITTNAFKESTYHSSYCHITSKKLISAGDQHLAGNRFEEALNSYYEAWAVAYRKGKLDNMVETWGRLGNTHRRLVESGIHTIENITFIVSYACNVINNCGGKLQQVTPALANLKFAEAYFLQEYFDSLPPNEQLAAAYRFCAAFTPTKLIVNQQVKVAAESSLAKYLDLLITEAERRLNDLDYADALNMSSQVNAPLEELAVLGSANLLLDAWRSRAAAIVAAGGGLEKIARAERIYTEQELDRGDEAKLGQALYCLDLLGEAKIPTRGCNVDQFCRIKVLEGKIQLSNLLNRKLAKNCFREAIDIGLSECFQGSDWFQEAIRLFEGIKKEEAEEEKRAAPDRSNLIKQLEAELKQLEEMEKWTHERFYEAVLEKFPPKHREEWNISQEEKKSMQKVYRKLSVFYHPDKVDVDMFGEKYKLLVEEIAKRVNCRYCDIKATATLKKSKQ